MTRPPLKAHLDALVRTQNAAARRETDPVSFVHRFARADDQEVVGLLAASLAFGNVVAVRRSVSRVLDVLGPRPAATVDKVTYAGLRAPLKDFVHRVYRGEDVARMLVNAGALRRKHGSLGKAFVASMRAADDDFREGLARFADGLRGANPSRGLAHLIPDPRAGSTCKRLLLYLRWMVRPADGVDLGLWPVDPARLLLPLDTHVFRIGRNVRLTQRRTPSWRAAEEMTAKLRVLDGADPVRYDFALCHMGISKACPAKRDPVLCHGCVLQPVCRHWPGSVGAGKGRKPRA